MKKCFILINILLFICFFTGCKKNNFYYKIENNEENIDASEYMVNDDTSLEHIFKNAPNDKATSAKYFNINLNELSFSSFLEEKALFKDIINGKPSLIVLFSSHCSACDHIEFKELINLLKDNYNLFFVSEYNINEEREYLKNKEIDLKYGYTFKTNKQTQMIKDLPTPSMLFVDSSGNIKIALEGSVNAEGALIFLQLLN